MVLEIFPNLSAVWESLNYTAKPSTWLPTMRPGKPTVCPRHGLSVVPTTSYKLSVTVLAFPTETDAQVLVSPYPAPLSPKQESHLKCSAGTSPPHQGHQVSSAKGQARSPPASQAYGLLPHSTEAATHSPYGTNRQSIQDQPSP